MRGLGMVAVLVCLAALPGAGPALAQEGGSGLEQGEEQGHQEQEEGGPPQGEGPSGEQGPVLNCNDLRSGTVPNVYCPPPPNPPAWGLADFAEHTRRMAEEEWRAYFDPRRRIQKRLRSCWWAPGNAPAQVAGRDPRGSRPRSGNPLAGERFFVDPTEPAWLAWRAARGRNDQRAAGLLWRIASTPRFRWWGRWVPGDVEAAVNNYLRCVRGLAPDFVPLMAVMRHQGKSCHRSYDGGGAGEDEATRRWYDRFARGVGDARVVIAFEPDSLGTLDCLARHRRKARLDVLRYGVDVLSKLPNATIYLEAGAADWEPASRTAPRLRYIGIKKVRGFMLNATHYEWTAKSVRYGRRLSRLVGGKPFIVSTSFNGRGPVHVRRRVSGSIRRLNVWCHPLKRGLGPPPAVSPAPKVDAYMWIGRPGYSGGSCNGGPLPIGTFWPERALMLSHYAKPWIGPPRGTRHGHGTRYSPRQLGYCGDDCT